MFDNNDCMPVMMMMLMMLMMPLMMMLKMMVVATGIMMMMTITLQMEYVVATVAMKWPRCKCSHHRAMHIFGALAMHDCLRRKLSALAPEACAISCHTVVICS